MRRNDEIDDLDDDTWFDSSSPIGRRGGSGRLNMLLVVGIAALVALGLALGAFATPGAGVDTAAESMRARARSAEGTRALSGSMLLEQVDRATQRGALKPVSAPVVEPEPKIAEPEPAPPEPEPLVVAEVLAPEPAKPVRPTRPNEPVAVVRPPANPVEKPVEKSVEPPTPAVAPPPAIAPASAIDQALIDGKSHLDARRWADARQAYDRALSASPGNTKALFGRGRALYELRQTQAAMKDFEAVLAVEGSHPNALLMAGSVAQELGRKEDARRFYQRYLDAWPTGRRAAEIKGLLERL